MESTRWNITGEGEKRNVESNNYVYIMFLWLADAY